MQLIDEYVTKIKMENLWNIIEYLYTFEMYLMFISTQKSQKIIG